MYLIRIVSATAGDALRMSARSHAARSCAYGNGTTSARQRVITRVTTGCRIKSGMTNSYWRLTCRAESVRPIFEEIAHRVAGCLHYQIAPVEKGPVERLDHLAFMPRSKKLASGRWPLIWTSPQANRQRCQVTCGNLTLGACRGTLRVPRPARLSPRPCVACLLHVHAGRTRPHRSGS
jgi:hypothetical protein